MKTGDMLEDMLGEGFSLDAVLSLARRQAEIATDFDGPATVRDVESEGPDTSPETAYPTLPCVYSREAA